MRPCSWGRLQYQSSKLRIPYNSVSNFALFYSALHTGIFKFSSWIENSSFLMWLYLLNGPRIHEQHFTFLPVEWKIYFSPPLPYLPIYVFIPLSHQWSKSWIGVCVCVLMCVFVHARVLQPLSHCDKVVWQAVSHAGQVVDGSSPTHDKACQSPRQRY